MIRFLFVSLFLCNNKNCISLCEFIKAVPLKFKAVSSLVSNIIMSLCIRVNKQKICLFLFARKSEKKINIDRAKIEG